MKLSGTREIFYSVHIISLAELTNCNENVYSSFISMGEIYIHLDERKSLHASKKQNIFL